MEIPNEELDKLYQLFNNGDYDLVLELCKSVDIKYSDLLKYVWVTKPITSSLIIKPNVYIFRFNPGNVANYFNLFDANLGRNIVSNVKDINDIFKEAEKHLQNEIT